MIKSKSLSDFLDMLSDKRTTAWQKVTSLVAVWRSSADRLAHLIRC